MRLLRCLFLVLSIVLCYGRLSASDQNFFPDGVLSFFNTHTQESIQVRYRDQDAQWNLQALEQLNYFFRCHTDDTRANMNPRLFVLIDMIQDHFGPEKTVQIISGYRSPALNAALHARSSGVAKHSRHMLGEAIDIRVSGVPAKAVYAYAWSLQQGGVGCYTGSNFVHVDVGPVRTWGI